MRNPTIEYTSFSFYIVALIGIVAAINTNCSAQDFWNNAAGGFFDVGTNWADGSAPGAAEDAFFNVAATYFVDFDGVTGNVTNNDLYVDGGNVTFRNIAATASPLTHTAGRHIVRNGAVMHLESLGSNNELNLDSGFILIHEGTLRIADGAEATASAATRIGLFGSGFLDVEDSGTQLTSDEISIGFESGIGGRLTLLDGAVANASFARIANEPNSSGVVEVSGTGSELNVTGTLRIGDFPGSFGQLDIFNGNTVDVGGLLMGFTAGNSLGFTTTINNNNSILNVDGNFFMGNEPANLNLRGSADIVVGANFINGPNGTIEDLGGVGFPSILATALTNQGTMSLGDAGSCIFADVVNSGTFESLGNALNIVNGTFQADNIGSIFTDTNASLIIDGTVSGSEFFDGDGDVSFLQGVRPGAGNGTGTTGTIEVAGDLLLSTSSVLYIEIGGTLGGSEYDRLWPDSDLEIAAGCQLSVSFIDGFVPTPCQEFTIVCPLAGSTITGEFAGLPEGAIAGSLGDVSLRISYTGGDGNDIVLTAAPFNDNWNTFASDLGTLPFTAIGNNFCTTIQPDEQHLDITSATVWWFFNAPADGIVTVDTFGSNFDTVLHVYTDFAAGFENLVLVAENDQAGGTNQSEVTFPATAGTFYEVRVGGFLGDVGVIQLNGTYACLRGDVNQDGIVDLLDISPFVAKLSTSAFCCEADVNNDGTVDLLDVAPFVDAIAGS